MPQASAPTLSPHRFGRFLLLESLGEGGMGRVYRAVLTGPSGFRKTVALKVLIPVAPHAEHAAIYSGSIRNEARLGALLRHPGLVEVYDHGVEAGLPWIAMELVDGVDLDAVFRTEGPLRPAAVIDLGLQLCSALQYAHAAEDEGRPLHLVHRDLKPANVLVDRYGRIKITDLGIARSALATVATTAQGMLKGTPTFMAPEQILGLPVDGRADLFAVGAILFEAATGRRLFRRDGVSATVAAVLACDEILLLGDDMEGADAVLRGLGDTLRGCLWRDPSVRYSSAEVLAEALIELSAQPAMLASGPGLGDIARRVDLRRRCARETLVTPAWPQAPAIPGLPPELLDEVEPALLSRTKIQAVGWPAKPAVGGPVPRARGIEGLLVVALTILVGLSGPDRLPPKAPAPPPVAIPMTFVGPFQEDGGPARRGVEPVDVPTLVAPARPPTPPPPVSAAAPPAAPVPARPARHHRVISRAGVGTSRSFIIEAPSQDLARVRLYLRANDEAWRYAPLSRVAGGYWGAVIPFDPSMEGTVAYWFEAQPVEGPAQQIGSAAAPWLIDVSR